MGSAVDFDSESYDVIDAYMNWVLETGLWDGRTVSWEEASEFSQEAMSRIVALLLSEDPEGIAFHKMAAQLARIGVSDSQALSLLDRDIAQIKILPDGMIVQVGLGRWMKKHSKAILIGVAAVAVITTVVVVAACSGGAAAGPAAAAGGGVLKGLASDNKQKSSSDKHRASPSSESLSLPAQPPTSTSAPDFPPISQPLSPTFLDQHFSNLGPSFPPPPKDFAPVFQNAITQVTQPFSFSDRGVQIGQQAIPYQDILQQIQREGIAPRPPTLSNEPAQHPFWLSKMLDVDQRANFPPQNMPTPNLTFPPNTEPSTLTRMLFDRELWDPNYPADRKIFSPTALPLIGDRLQGTITCDCGIANTAETVAEGGNCLYDKLGGKFAVQPNWIHDESLLYGLSMVFLEKNFAEPSVFNTLCGVLPSAVLNAYMENSDVQHSIEFKINQLSTKAKEIIETRNPNLKQVVVAFSNGGYVLKEALKQLPPEYRDTVVAITAGSTAIIDENLACKAYNLIGDKDWPSRLCNGGEKQIAEAIQGGRVKIIQQTDTQPVIGGHYFVQPEYQTEISRIIKNEVSKEYEIN